MPRRRTAALLGLLLAALLLAGCSGDDETEAVAPRTELPSTPAEALWNPCSALDRAEVNELFDVDFSQQTGTPAAPVCTFTPTREGRVVIDVNYNLFQGTLRDIVRQLGTPNAEGATLTAPRLRHADGARIISTIDEDDTLAVTGFVRNGRLIQVVNAIDPAPYDKPAIVRGVRALMNRLAERAHESGLSGPKSR